MIRPVASPSLPVLSPNAGNNEKLRAAAQQFEAVILREMISTMRKAKLADDVFGSSATDSFREMADARTADALSALGHFGIADMVERQFAGRSDKP